MKTRVLVVEDEVKIVDLITRYLELEGYDCYRADNGISALQAFQEIEPDLIILDLHLPKLDGLAVCARIRAESETPLILLTARVDEIDRLTGFARGADDYVCKPFNPKELMARVKAVLRRAKPDTEKNVLSYGPLTLTKNEHSLKIEGNEIVLTQMEFLLLTAFVNSPSHVFSREELLSIVHGKYAEPYERTIDFHIKNLRKKINIIEGSRFIKTVYGLGYKFV